MKSYFSNILFLLLFSLIAQFSWAGNDKNYTVIVSLDGFRWDYPLIHNTPNLNKISRIGVSAVMRPSYPASTFSNHYTLITGLVPDHHGIVNNSFWDRKNKRQYGMEGSITYNIIKNHIKSIIC